MHTKTIWTRGRPNGEMRKAGKVIRSMKLWFPMRFNFAEWKYVSNDVSQVYKDHYGRGTHATVNSEIHQMWNVYTQKQDHERKNLFFWKFKS